MSSISKPNTFSANTTMSSSEVNDNFDTIYNDYNGSISSVNLASNAVTTAKITDANVTTAKLADASVTSEKLSATVAFSAVPTQSISSGTQTTITTYTELADIGNDFTSGIFVAPYDGLYCINAHVQFDDMGLDKRVVGWIYTLDTDDSSLNLFRVESPSRASTHDTGVSVTITYKFTAGQKARFDVFQESGSTKAPSTGIFSGFLVGRT